LLIIAGAFLKTQIPQDIHTNSRRVSNFLSNKMLNFG
jgi:hypothetical protein